MCKVVSVYTIYIHLDPEIYIKVQVLTDQTLTNTNFFKGNHTNGPNASHTINPQKTKKGPLSLPEALLSVCQDL